jgi:hypothetical protein
MMHGGDGPARGLPTNAFFSQTKEANRQTGCGVLLRTATAATSASTASTASTAAATFA